MKMSPLALALLVSLALVACTRSPEPTDPGSMTAPPPLADVIGTDEISRTKAEEVYFRCSQVPRRKRSNDPWCQLRDRASACTDGTCKKAD